jgi:hypothetical protein
LTRRAACGRASAVHCLKRLPSNHANIPEFTDSDVDRAVHDALTAIRADSWMRRSALELGRRKRNPR